MMSLRQRIYREIREIALITLYFLVCFSFFLSLKKLLLEEYHVSLYVFHAAVIGALVVAKVVVLLDKTSFGNRFQNRSVIAHAIWRSAAYTAVVFVVTLAEQVGEVYFEKGSASEALSSLWGHKEFEHFLALNLTVAFSFLIYNTFAEMDRRIGPGSIRRLLLSAPATRPGAAPAKPTQA